MDNAMELKMCEAIGKKIRLTTKEGSIIVGKCEEFTSACDNTPEESSIFLDSPEKDGKICPWYMEIYQHEIKSIELI